MTDQDLRQIQARIVAQEMMQNFGNCDKVVVSKVRRIADGYLANVILFSKGLTDSYTDCFYPDRLFSEGSSNVDSK